MGVGHHFDRNLFFFFYSMYMCLTCFCSEHNYYCTVNDNMYIDYIKYTPKQTKPRNKNVITHYVPFKKNEIDYTIYVKNCTHAPTVLNYLENYTLFYLSIVQICNRIIVLFVFHGRGVQYKIIIRRYLHGMGKKKKKNIFSF